MAKKLNYANDMKDFSNVPKDFGADHSYLGSLAGSVPKGMKPMGKNPKGKDENEKGIQPYLGQDKIKASKSPFKQKKESQKMEDSED